jgi:glutamate/aspartate transport system permease protein
MDLIFAIDWDVIVESLPFLFMQGMRFSVSLTLVATAGGIILGTLLALMRLSKNSLIAAVAGTYVDFIRSIPLLMVIFWFFFLVPVVGQVLTRSPQPLQMDPFWSSAITFIMFEAAYFCEILRSGISAIPKGQGEAAKAMGMTYWQSMSSVVLPQAFRIMTPLVLTQMIILFQDTSLVYVLSITDFLGAASIIARRDGRLVEMYLFAALVYFVICFLLSMLVRRIDRRLAIIR